jgi:anti-anti-sigma regulatory factor
MLRITMTENASEQRWVLQGRLTGAFLEELTANWHSNRGTPSTRELVVDLNEVTYIDKDCGRVLVMMIKDGARFVATGVYTRHLLESLQRI